MVKNKKVGAIIYIIGLVVFLFGLFLISKVLGCLIAGTYLLYVGYVLFNRKDE